MVEMLSISFFWEAFGGYTRDYVEDYVSNVEFSEWHLRIRVN